MFSKGLRLLATGHNSAFNNEGDYIVSTGSSTLSEQKTGCRYINASGENAGVANRCDQVNAIGIRAAEKNYGN
jgi:hypothetical protein